MFNGAIKIETCRTDEVILPMKRHTVETLIRQIVLVQTGIPHAYLSHR
jgi:hypothetical protein